MFRVGGSCNFLILCAHFLLHPFAGNVYVLIVNYSQRTHRNVLLMKDNCHECVPNFAFLFQFTHTHMLIMPTPEMPPFYT